MTPAGPILLIDDEPAVAQALALVLNVLQFEVTAETSPRRALELLASTHPACVLCDLKMPELTGLDVLRELRRIRADLPFVLMSAHATRADIERASAEGANAFLPKPFTPTELLRVLTELKIPKSKAPSVEVDRS